MLYYVIACGYYVYSSIRGYWMQQTRKCKVIHKVLSMGHNFTFFRKYSNEFKERSMIRWLPILMFESKGLSWDVVPMVVLNIFFHYVYT